MMKRAAARSDRCTGDVNAGRTIKIISVVGARPNFMKVAPIIRAIDEHNKRGIGPEIQHLLVHTGQHYDALMSDRFFTDLALPKPDVHLGAGSGSQASQTAEILQKFENVLVQEYPDAVIVVGDVNSTVACALATAKFPLAPGRRRPLIAHVEAGLRSFDRAMPEEINRTVTDHLADLLFVTEKSGLVNLRREGIPPEKIFLVGNTMIDSLLIFKDRANESPILNQLGLCVGTSKNGGRHSARPYALLTLHRPSNVDEAEAFRNILSGLSELSRKLPIIFPVHPRTRKRLEEFQFGEYFQTGATENRNGIRLIDPLGYVDFLCMMKNARLVLTDSGGIQEETTCLGVPCVTIRENTERPVTVRHGTNVIAGMTVEGIRKAIARQLSRTRRASIPEKWDGKTAQRIVEILVRVSAVQRISEECGVTLARS
jgi:UDP-N-acetylglucosamine 2-epimerase (non-hydrolysing)